MGNRTSSIPVDKREVDDLIIKILLRHPFGLSADKIRKDLPPSHRLSKENISARFDNLLKTGRVHIWIPPIGKAKKPPSPIFSLEPLESLVGNHVVQLLGKGPLTPTEIKKSFPTHINKYLLNILDTLIKNKTIKWHPPIKGKRLGLQEPNPADFLSTEIKKVFEKGKKLGFQEEVIGEAIQKFFRPSPVSKKIDLISGDVEGLIFKTMTTIKPAAAHGALVYIPDLRKALRDRFPDKKSFDQAVLNLAKLEKVQLQSHSLPSELTEEQRAAMIDNQRGSYFMAIGIRME